MKRSTTWAVVAVGCVLAVAPARADASAPASCYGSWEDGYLGGTTASGEVIRHSTVGVAHRSLPFGTLLGVSYAGRAVRVRVIDRGPFIAGRLVDLTWGAVKRLGFNNCRAWGVRRVRTWRIR